MRPAKIALFIACLVGFAPLNPAFAQSITAAPDSTGTIINYNGNTYRIEGGTQAGVNLFHSFQQFGLQPSEIADFLSNPEISNVVGRVIGGDPSVIEGLIRLSGGSSNLFLVNPAGWVFTDGASVDVPGSFGVTTANRIGFGAGFFNAAGDNDYAALTGDPTSLIFDSAQPGAIINAADLNAANGSLWMVGGSVISTGSITAPNGTVTLAAVPGESKVKLSHEGMTLSLVLDALSVDEIQPNMPIGIRTVDLPTYLNGSGAVGNANEVVRTENGELWLVGSQLRVEDGDVVVGDRITAETVDLLAAGQVSATQPSQITGKTTVVRYPGADDDLVLNIIDRHADNPEALLFGGRAGTISTIVEDTEDGIAAVSTALGRIAAPLDGMSITAEGNTGNFWLGNTWLTSESIADYQDQLAAWSQHFTEAADLLLYSCFTALGETGDALMAGLATATGLDVAASVNATGSANQGGDWVLERSTGEIETQNPFTAETLADWEGRLATFTVQNGNDSGTGSLRAEIVNANGAAGTDEIRFANGVTNVTLTTAELEITDALKITGGGTNVTVERSTAAGTPEFRIFHVSTAVATEFEDLTIKNGRRSGAVLASRGAGILSRGFGATVTLINSTISGNSSGLSGGGISTSYATLINSTVSGNTAYSIGGGINTIGITLTNSTVSDNISTTRDGGGISAGTSTVLINSTVSGNTASKGGGIYHSGGSDDITLINSTLSGNYARDRGGGIYSDLQNITLTNSTVSDNTAYSRGGGISTLANVTLTNSTVSGNSANVGGGINTPSDVILTNSTVSGNSALSYGGGISGDDITLTNSTISGNYARASGGGGIVAQGVVTATNATIAFNTARNNNGGGIYALTPGILNNTIVSNNSAGGTSPDLSGTFTANYSLILNPSGATISGSNNIFGQDPLLQPLAFNNNFGRAATQTHAIPANSPALNAGSNALANLAGLTTDQRGLAARIFGGRVDIGAYELNPNADVFPFSFAEIYLDSLEDSENLVDQFIQGSGCQTVPEIELEKDDTDGEPSEADLDAADGIDLDENCLPSNGQGGGGDTAAMEPLLNHLARRQ